MAWKNFRTPISERPADLGLRLLARRRKAGWSQTELAEAAGLSVRTVRRAEAGRPSADTTSRLLCALGMSTEALVPGWSPSARDDRADVGTRIRERRRALGENLDVIAGALVMSKAQLSRFERGLGVPRRWLDGRRPDEVTTIGSEKLALILSFRGVADLNDYLTSPDWRDWHEQARALRALAEERQRGGPDKASGRIVSTADGSRAPARGRGPG